jgi:hypothetical protein
MYRTADEVVNLSFKISDEEKKSAKRCIDLFDKAVHHLNELNDYLDKIYNPFKNHNKVSAKSVHRYRGAIKRYSDSIDDKTSYIKKVILLAVGELDMFSSDMKIQDILNALSDDMSDTDEQIFSLRETLESWDLAVDKEPGPDNNDNIDYRQTVISAVELAKKEIAESINLIEDRIITHINDNILSNNWVQNVSNELEVEEDLED